jgi:protein-disulfide isomerase
MTAAGEPPLHVLGNPEAPITVVEFGDYECPYCAGAAPILRNLVEQSEGQVRLVFRNFPLFETHSFALVAALAVESTTGSGFFWQMHEHVFKKQAHLDDDHLRQYAADVGADPELATGAAAQQFAPIVQADYAAGVELGVHGTPTLFINDVPYIDRVELGALQKATGTSTDRRRPGKRR